MKRCEMKKRDYLMKNHETDRYICKKCKRSAKKEKKLCKPKKIRPTQISLEKHGKTSPKSALKEQ